MRVARCNDNCRFITGNIASDFCTHHKQLQKGYSKYFSHKNIALQSKLMALDPWFNDLIKNDSIIIHDIDYINIFGTVVFWSDNQGFSYSYKSSDGQGISGTYKNITACVKAIAK